MAWSFRGRSTPAGVGRRSVAKALRRAGTNIVTGRNTCRMPDRLTATQRYLGRTAAQPNISSASACLKPDGRSVVGFGTIDSSELGFTCWWTIGDRTVEADMMLNSVNYGWTTNPGAACQGRWSVEAVATHEFGHAFGLGHVSPVLDANQTMSPVITPCQNAQATLGRGDVLGLRAVY
jgi:predicted Zn-dependent protease